jgi:LmbE family N-acetylglucosaminyl deacetylase
MGLSVGAKAQESRVFNVAELEIAFQKLNVLGSVLYVGAHPDDEDAAVLAYLSKARKYRTAYLSLTRGEGGQNLIGPEQGAAIGIIRTQELLAARRLDGAEQFFTRAVDFGYSKTAEETFAFWGKEKVLADIVWVIRNFQPDVILSRFTAESADDHGHHVASALLIKEAFAAAADPGRFPGQLRGLSPWKAKRLLWNVFRPTHEGTTDRLWVDTGEYNPLLGKSYSEIAGESRSQHKSQGVGSAWRRGTRHDYFEMEAGDPAINDIFEGIDVSWDRLPGGHNIGLLLADSLKRFEPQHPSKAIPLLVRAYAELAKVPGGNWVRAKKRELLRVIQACGGIWMDATADDFSAAPGDMIQIRTTLINRSDYPFSVHSLGVSKIGPDVLWNVPLKNNEPFSSEQAVLIPKEFPISQPYWLQDTFQDGPPSFEDQTLSGLAEDPPALCLQVRLSADGQLLEYSVPLVYRWTDPVGGELTRPFEIRPRVTIQINDRICLFPDKEPRKVKIRLQGQSPKLVGLVRIKGPDSWKISPGSRPFSLTGKYEESEVIFEVWPPRSPGQADLTVEADLGGEKIARSLAEISYPHIRRQVYFPDSRFKVVNLDIKTVGQRIGYIKGAGDEIPEALEDLGYDVTPLSDEILETRDLSHFDAIITGVRAYNTRSSLRLTQGRLLRYVAHGGTLIVQYNVAARLLVDRIGPYPLTIGRDRVCVENAPVVLLAPEHPLLNFPNKITAEDFEGWIQERGLSFASTWDEKYDILLSCHDPGEPEKLGGLLYARYGEGVFIYTGYAWFRQLPAGVPGAFRIFANMIAAGKDKGGAPVEK